MRIHPITGQVAHGNGGRGVLADGQRVVPFTGQNGMPDWLKGQLIYSDELETKLVNVDGTGNKRLTSKSSWTRGSQVGEWSAFEPYAQGRPEQGKGTWTSWGLELESAVLLGMAPDGTLMVGDQYHPESGTGLSIYKAGTFIASTRWPNARPSFEFPYSQAAILDANRYCWTELGPNNRQVLHGSTDLGPAPVLPWGVKHVTLLDAPGVAWLIYLRTEDDSVLIHPWDYRGVGFMTGDGKDLTFGPNGIFLDGEIRAYWSRTKGEEPTDIQTKRSIPADAQPITPVQPPVVVVPPVVAPNVPSVAFAGMWGATDTAPGNIAIGSPRYTHPRHTCVIASDATVKRKAMWLVYLGGSLSDEDIAQIISSAIVEAEKERLPLGIYDETQRRHYRYAWIKKCCGDYPWIVMHQWYLEPSEDPAAFVRDVITIAKTFEGHRMLAVIRAFTGGTLVPEPAVVAALNELVIQDALKLYGLIGWIFYAWEKGPNSDAILNRPLLQPAIDVWMKTPTTVTDARAWADDFFSPEVPTMDVPDLSHVVRELFETGAFDIQTHTGCGIFTDAAVRALYAADPEFGQVIKHPGQNQYPDDVGGHAVDAALHRSSGRTVDFITNTPDDDESDPTVPPGIGWGVDIPRYTDKNWRAPSPQPRSSIVRPALPFVLGMSAFDWCTHRDPTWLDLHVEFKLPYLRLIHQSVYRTPRTLAEGLAQLDAALPIIAARGLGALVSLNCDTREYGMTPADVIANTIAGNAIIVKHAHLFKPLYLLPDLGNEVQNGNEQPFMMDPFFLKQLDALVDPRFTLGWAPMFGTGIAPAATGGSWIPHHSDRGLTVEENALIMASAQAKYGKPVMNREPTGFAEPGTPGQRTWDIAFARALGVTAKQHGLSTIYHTQAGLRANVAEFGPSHRAGAVALVEGLGGAIVIVPPPPPPEVDALVTWRNKAIDFAIDISYATLLNRKPDPVGIAIYRQRLREGWTVPQMEDDIKASPEYKVVHG